MEIPDLQLLSDVLEEFEIKATASPGVTDVDGLAHALAVFPELSWMVWRDEDKWRAVAFPLARSMPPGVYVQM